MSVGLSANIGAPVDEDEPLPALTTLLTLAATALMFLTDLHLEVFKALEASYNAACRSPRLRAALRPRPIASKANEAFLPGAAHRQPVPDLLAGDQRRRSGLIGRLVPGIQSFFLSAPFLLLGGLLLLLPDRDQTQC